MKAISAGLKTALAQGSTTLARIYTIVRKDGTTLRFTDHDTDLVFEGNTYVAFTGADISSIATSASRQATSTQVRVVFTSGYIEELDCIRGRYDGAEMTVSFVDWSDLTLGDGVLIQGVLGSFQNTHKGYGDFELFNKFAQLRRPIGLVYSPECRADLGDSRCTVDLATLNQTITVSTVASRSFFTGTIPVSKAASFYAQGVLTWTSGGNNGFSVEVLSDPSGTTTRTIRLVLPMPAAIQAGDTATLYAGCDKRITTCKNKFANAINFQGEPAVPGALFASGYPMQ